MTNEPSPARAFEIESGRWAAVEAINALQAKADALRQLN
jgi:hypothetical protein